MTGLSDTQTRVLTYLQGRVTDLHCPTYREIGAACGLASTSQVSGALDALRRGGWIKLDYRGRRSIHLTDPIAGKSTAELIAMRDRIDAILKGRAS